MSQEIVYTSAPEGLKQGSKGFCTVQSTSGMAKNLAQRLEALSGYRHEFSDQTGGLQNPVNYSHLKLNVAGQQYHVLSRICDYGIDYSRRTNKLAHHVALRRAEVVKAFAGPAAALATPGFCKTKWDGKPKLLGAGTDLTRVDQSVSPEAVVCKHWERLTGDAGWGGVLAESAIARAGQPAFVIFPPPTASDNQDQLLHLVLESLKLVPPNKRWDVTFSTYYTELLDSEKCQWRFVMEGTKEAQALRSNPHASYIDLCSGGGPVPQSDLAVAARGLMPPPWAAAPQTATPASTPARGSHPAAAAQAPLDTLLPVEPDAAAPIHQQAAAATLPPMRGAPPDPFARRRKPVNYWLFAAIALMFMLPVMFIGGYFAAGGFTPRLPVQTAGTDTPTEPVLTGSMGAAPASDAVGGDGPVDEDFPTATEDAPTTNSNGADEQTGDESSAELATTTPAPLTAEGSTDGTSPEPNTSAETGEPPLEQPPDPFEDLDKRTVDAAKDLVLLELPPAPRGLSNRDISAEEIAQLFVDDPNECEMEVIGADVVFGEKLTIHIDHTLPETWEVVAEERRSKTKLGTFSLDGSTLSFQWEAKRARLQPDRLRWCLLAIRVGEQSRLCRLRSPSMRDAENFVPVESKFQIPLADEGLELPPPESLKFALRAEGLPEHKPERPKSRSFVLRFMASKKPRSQALFELEWDVDLNAAPPALVMQCWVTYSELTEDDKRFEPPLTKRPPRWTLGRWNRDQHNVRVQELKQLQKQYEGWRTDAPNEKLQAAINWMKKPPEDRPKNYQTKKYPGKVMQWNATLDTALAEVAVNQNRLARLDALIEKIGENGQWHYRIYITIDGRQMDLIRTRGFPES